MFRTVLLDPPWPERGGGRIVRGAQRHYSLINTKPELLETIVTAEPWRQVNRGGAHIYMWSTDNYLSWAMWLFEALGAKHHRVLPWTKRRMGIGQYFRGCHELLLFGTIGKGMEACNVDPASKAGPHRTDALVNMQHTIDSAGRRVHSGKPVEQYAIIERRSKGEYLEMFAREQREGWTAWGHGANR